MGALEALNGVILIGLTTALLYGLIQRVWPVENQSIASYALVKTTERCEISSRVEAQRSTHLAPHVRSGPILLKKSQV